MIDLTTFGIFFAAAFTLRRRSRAGDALRLSENGARRQA